MQIRFAEVRDEDNLKAIYTAAFPVEEVEPVTQLCIELLREESNPITCSIVAERDGVIIAHVAFSPVVIEGRHACQGYILAPLAVDPDYQKQGVGTQLVEYGLQLLEQKKADIVFVYGDPQYYSRFGFNVEAAALYQPPYPLEYAFGWQAKILNECRTAKSETPITCVKALSKSDLW